MRILDSYRLPDGSLLENRRTCARTDLQLELREDRSIRLFQGLMGPTPSGAEPVEVRARLLNPTLSKGHRFAQQGEPAILLLR